MTRRVVRRLGDMLSGMKRREFLTASGMVGASLAARGMRPFDVRRLDTATPPALKAKRVQPGQTVGLVAPATAIFQDVEVDIARESLEGLGLKVRIGEHLRDKHGYLAGADKARAEDINRFFKDDNIAA